jgi:hypothetical protein
MSHLTDKSFGEIATMEVIARSLVDGYKFNFIDGSWLSIWSEPSLETRLRSSDERIRSKPRLGTVLGKVGNIDRHRRYNI